MTRRPHLWLVAAHTLQLFVARHLAASEGQAYLGSLIGSTAPRRGSNPVMMNIHLLTSTIRRDAPSAFTLLGDVRGAEDEPRLGEPQRVVQVGEGVELDRAVSPLAFDARAQLGREARRLMNVPTDDLLVLSHVRDPLTSGSKKAFRVWGSTRKAGSRHGILVF